MRVLITGGGGYLGRATVDAAVAGGHDVWRTRRTASATSAVVDGDVDGPPGVDVRWVDVDLADPAATVRAVERLEPEVVIHTAYVRGGPEAAVVIVGATTSLAAVTAARGARLVHVSTDAVFSGAIERPLDEHEPVSPTTTYGLLKAQAEVEVTRANENSVVVRTSLLYGGPDRVGPQEALVQAAARGAGPEFYTDEVRAPAHVEDVAAGLVALARMNCTGVFHVVGPEGIDRLTFARRLARQLGEDAEALRGCTVPAGSSRPRHVVLACDRFDREIGGRRRSVRDVPGSDRNKRC